MDDLLSLDQPDSTEAAALAGRLRFAAESLAVEFENLSSVEAERLIFGVARQFLSDAQIVQFVPTLATRRARQLLRTGPPGESGLFVDLVAAEASGDVDGTVPDEPGGAHEPPTVTVPLSPTFYADEAKRLLERARALRTPAPPGADRSVHG
jgi:hypothetical protein